MNGKETDVVLKLIGIVDRLLSGRRPAELDIGRTDGPENRELLSLAAKIVNLGEQYRDSYDFIMDLSSGKLSTEAPRQSVFAGPFKQLHSELRHLTWQIGEIADGDYDQQVSFSGDFAEAINKMIGALREKQVLMGHIRENENLFRSIFGASPDGIVLCGPDHRIVRSSDAACRMLQICGETGIHFSNLIHQDDAENFRNFLGGLLGEKGRETVFAELRIVLPDGTAFWTEQHASLLLDSAGKPKGYIIIIRDITKRKADEAQLRQYTEELGESNSTKDKLFSIIAHDLKSPFNALLGFGKMLVREANRETPDIERMRKFSKQMDESTERSYGLLVNLLDWARLQSAGIMVEHRPMNLSEVIADNVDIARTVAVRKNIALEYTAPGNLPIVSDRAIINTILRNLLGNAIKYTPQNGRIAVSASGDGCTVSVRDSGMGIPAENLETIFLPGNIHSTPGTAGEKGTGLGLALCRDFVHKIGGDIWVESTCGHGATFTFSLKKLPTDGL